ncbi:MAG: hydantoinase/oxoprolinase family protein [Albidovulum sp.]|nr:hydantoinase/oxoprolinase family protein [Albidovulum sp.]
MTAGAVARVATDVGGTFTDLACFRSDPDRRKIEIFTANSDTTPPEFERGMLDLLDRANIDLARVDFLAHGTAVAINAITERNGAKVGLVATEGFRGTLEIGRGSRPDSFYLYYRKPRPFVPRSLRRELPGRMSNRGVETRPPDIAPLAGIVEGFRRDVVEAIALCFLHSYANPDHELMAAAEVRGLWRDEPVICSCDISREWREYERTNTTVLSGYVQPGAASNLKRLESGLAERGFSGSPYVTQSNRGIDSLDAASRRPVALIESGPASGIWGAAELGKLIGDRNVLALDIGGTTAKCSLVESGSVKIITDHWGEKDRKSAGYPGTVPVVDLVETGNGGGSIARVDGFQKLHVGPRSAGAVPGPAAYGRGGPNATTIDANLWLGRINRERFQRARKGIHISTPGDG